MTAMQGLMMRDVGTAVCGVDVKDDGELRVVYAIEILYG